MIGLEKLIEYPEILMSFGTHWFEINCVFGDFNWVFAQIRCLSVALRSTWQLKRISYGIVLEKVDPINLWIYIAIMLARY